MWPTARRCCVPSVTSSDGVPGTDPWPESEEELRRLQTAIGTAARRSSPAHLWAPGPRPLLGGCFVVFAPAVSGDRAEPERAWAAAVAWSARHGASHEGRPWRRSDDALRGATAAAGPRRAADVEAQVVIEGRVSARYEPGLLARRHGAMLHAAADALEPVPEVLLVDATGLDHPRGAGLAVHLGAVLGVPTVGVTDRSLLATGDRPPPVRGTRREARVEGRLVGYWVRTRSTARPVLAHAAWRTDPDGAVATVLAASTEAARTPVPIQEARRVAREARAAALAG